MTTRARRSVRTRLTLLYAVPFFAVGAILLLVPTISVDDTEPAGAGSGRPGVGVGVHLVWVVVGLPLVALIALLLGWFVAGRYLRPLHAITATAREISASSLDRRLALPGRDEFGELAATLDELYGRLRASFESQRHFVANASHELRTPLSAERALLQLALDDPDATVETLRETCRELLELNVAQEHLVDALLTLATGEQGVARAEPVDLADVAARVVSAAAGDAGTRRIVLCTDLDGAPARGDRALLASLVTNLVDNALRYNRTGGRVEVGTCLDGAGRARLRVANTGPAVPPDELPRLFRPFQRLDGNRVRRGGHGLGLAIVRAVTDAHGGELAPAARPDGGLTITIAFPAPPRSTAP
ncbi:sensor histidine kinase [Actinocatenispora sera]|uniref:histidine kinase n=1 Tax=Actinocatenispora sera TaxID=390989 RepID=A0A810L381_9ACTN|nr:HAMP domain-containing sensor histidine kinase [Actinocatenispora sera]BCJ29409.1 two-component sensor histidine kinase [Actinocatenispora sera]